MRSFALLLAVLVGAQRAASQFQGFIRTSNLKFVDDNCKEFVPLGMNTYVLHAHWRSLHCTYAGFGHIHTVHALVQYRLRDETSLQALHWLHDPHAFSVYFVVLTSGLLA